MEREFWAFKKNVPKCGPEYAPKYAETIILPTPGHLGSFSGPRSVSHFISPFWGHLEAIPTDYALIVFFEVMFWIVSAFITLTIIRPPQVVFLAKVRRFWDPKLLKKKGKIQLKKVQNPLKRPPKWLKMF